MIIIVIISLLYYVWVHLGNGNKVQHLKVVLIQVFINFLTSFYCFYQLSKAVELYGKAIQTAMIGLYSVPFNNGRSR